MPSTSASGPSRGAHFDALAGRGLRSRAQAVSPFAPALGAYYVQTRTFDLIPLLYALPAGSLAAALRGAPQRALRIAAYLLIAVGTAAGTFVRWAALPLLTAPLAWALVRAPAPAGDEAARARVYLVFGMLL